MNVNDDVDDAKSSGARVPRGRRGVDGPLVGRQSQSQMDELFGDGCLGQVDE